MGDNARIISIVDEGLSIDGTISSRGKLVIKGTVKGTINGDTVVIAREGAVHANTRVSRITVGGVFEGSLRASEELIILKTGNCAGMVECRDLVVEAGGVLNADITCLSAKDGPAPKKRAAPKKT